MSSKLQVPKGLSIEVVALMADWQEVRGRFFLAEYAQNHYGQETLLDVLNSTGNKYIPLAQDGETPVLLIQRSRIVGIRPSRAEASQWSLPLMEDEQCWPQVKMSFAGFSLEGRAYTGDMPPHRRRIIDLLNHGPIFFLLETDEDRWVVNKNLLNHLVPMV